MVRLWCGVSNGLLFCEPIKISSGTHIYQKFYLIFEVYAWVVKEDHLCSSDKRLMGCWFDEGQAGLEMHREFAVK